nr:BatD family protein [Thiocystis violacea]
MSHSGAARRASRGRSRGSSRAVLRGLGALAIVFGFIVAGIPNLFAQPYGYGPGAYGQPYYAPPYSGQQPQQPGQPQSQFPQFRPVPPTNAQGAPPRYAPRPAQPQMPTQPQGQAPYGYPGYQQPNYQQPGYQQPGYQQPGWAPGYGQAPYAATQRQAPQVEWRLEELDPYLQQPVILHLDVVSSDNLSTANLELAPSGDFLIKTLKGPDTSTRERDGRREIVNSFVLTVVPLRAGDLALPSIKVSGDQVIGGMTQRYEARTEQSLHLQVRPSMTSVRPWLPLRSLTLKSSLDREGTLEPGQPVTLALEIEGVGATAVQLPSLENQLVGPDFRVYREQTLTDTQLSSNERQLTATRTEYYTLVPQVGGRISLPEMSIAWWNVDLGTREVARLPIKTLSIRGGGPFGFSTSALTASGWAKIWIPLAGIFLLIAGYWVGVFYRGRPWQLSRASLGVLWRALKAGLGFIGRRIGPSLEGLKPAVVLPRARAAMRRALPAGSQLQRCIRQANRAATPEDWCAVFEEESRGCLRLKGDFTQPTLTRQIVSLRPGASRERLEQLMRQLDAARYGRESIDFTQWKRELMGQLRPGAGLTRRTKAEGGVRWAALPALNPSA